MSILLTRTNEAYGTYKILILYEDKLINYDAVKNDIKFWEKWTDNLKKELNNRYYIILNILESLKELEGKKEKLKDQEIDLFSDRVNKSIRIIFSIVNNTNIIIVWGIGYHEEAYRDILRRAESFIKNHQKLILELLGIKTIYR